MLTPPQAKRKSRKGPDAEWSHAAQIFCEMLGQVCHPVLYSLDPEHYLEVPPIRPQPNSQAFVIQARHTSARLFYCKFPVAYLRNVAKHGAKYTAQVPVAHGVHLQHTKNYQLREPSSREDFFRLLCRLFSYLASGRSHVPFLWNHPLNPINTVLHFGFDGRY
jgi:hypothetical protein